MEVLLRGGHVMLIDAEDWEKLRHHKWHAYRNKNTHYVIRDIRLESGKRRPVPIHREIMAAPADRMVDHINRDGLDNRKQNLRLCSRLENNRNAVHPKPNQSQFHGVRWVPRLQKWEARIWDSGRFLYCGIYTTDIEAAKARDAAAIRLRGEFATLNFPAHDRAQGKRG